MNINDEIKRIIKEDMADKLLNILFENKIEKIIKLNQSEFDFYVDNLVMCNLLKLELYKRYELYEMCRIADNKVKELINVKKNFYKKNKIYEPEFELLPVIYNELLEELIEDANDEVLIDLIYRSNKL